MPPVNYDARSLVPDFEPAIRQLMGAYQQRQEQQQQDQALGLATDLAGVGGMDALLSPDNAPMLLRLNRMNPELFQTVGKIALARDEKQTQQLIEESEKAKNIYKAILSFEEPAERSRYLADKIKELEANGQDASKLRELIGKSPDQMRLYANARIVEAGDASMIGQASLDDMKKQMELRTEELRQQQLEQNMRLAQTKEQRDAAEAQRAAQESGRGGYAEVSGLRKEFTAQSQPFIAIRDAFGRLQASAQQESAAGDMAMIFNYMKILDPGSVVREGEFANAQNAAGVPDRILNAYNNALRGERLNPAQRQDFLGTAKSLYEKQLKSQRDTEKRYASIARNRNLPPEDVVIDFNSFADEAAAAPPQQPGGPLAGNPDAEAIRAAYRAGQLTQDQARAALLNLTAGAPQ